MIDIDATQNSSRYSNSLVGVAAGDAWGYQVEFTRYQNMPAYPVEPPSKTWRISDDTQMTLAVHDALCDVADPDDIDAVTAALTARFQEWKASPQNNRAPGRTCMGSLSNLAAGSLVRRRRSHRLRRLRGSDALGSDRLRGRRALARPHSTPGRDHAQASASSGCSPRVGRCSTARPARTGNMLIHAAAAAAAIYDGTSPWLTDRYLGRVLEPVTDNVGDYLTTGLDDGLTDALTATLTAQEEIRELIPADYGDPCWGIGEGWESASAVALALLVADQATGPDAPLDPAAGLGWAATSNGDSDSIASMAGALIGAASSEPRFWTQTAKLDLNFERRYARALTRASRSQVSVGRAVQ